MPAPHDRSRISLFTLTWPILVENLLRTSFLSLDTLMLSNYSEHAVAAMSIVNAVGFFIQLLYFMVGTGANILISQNLGARQYGAAGRVGVGSLLLIVLFSLVVSLVAWASTDTIVGLFDLEPLVRDCASVFIRIYTGASAFLALNIVQSNILRSWGNSRDSMVVNIIMLGLTVGICVFGLFGPFYFSGPGLLASTATVSPLVDRPTLVVDGMTWVAVATVAGQALTCIVFAVILRWRKEIVLPIREIFRIPKRIYRSILAVGVPTAGETLSYNLAQLVILSMVSTMGTEALAAYGILIALLRYVFIFGVSVGMGTQIKVGYFVGAGAYETAHRRVYLYVAVGFLVTLSLALSLYLTSQPLIGLFSQKESVFVLIVSVLFVAVFHEPGRSINTVLIPGLKGAGDVLFPVIIGLVSMWGIGVFVSYLLGVQMGLGLVGIWIALAMDEWLRGIVMLGRWRSRVWMKKTLVLERQSV